LSGNSFILSCEEKSEENEKPSLIYHIETDEETIMIDEARGFAEFFSKNNHSVNHIKEVQMLHQSGLTHIQVQQILQTGLSHLPVIEESFEIHKPLLRILQEQYFRVSGNRIDELPIT
jgi:hypothetical protein